MRQTHREKEIFIRPSPNTESKPARMKEYPPPHFGIVICGLHCTQHLGQIVHRGVLKVGK